MILKSILNSGKKWSKISKQLNGRPENSIKNHYIKLLSQHKIEKSEDNDSPEFRQKLTALLEKFSSTPQTKSVLVKNQPDASQTSQESPREKEETLNKVTLIPELIKQVVVKQSSDLGVEKAENTLSYMLNAVYANKPEFNDYSPTIKLQYKEKPTLRSLPADPYHSYPDFYSYPVRGVPMMYPMMEQFNYPYQSQVGLQYAPPPQYGPPYWSSGRYSRMSYFPIPNSQSPGCSHSHKCCNHNCWES